MTEHLLDFAEEEERAGRRRRLGRLQGTLFAVLFVVVLAAGCQQAKDGDNQVDSVHQSCLTANIDKGGVSCKYRNRQISGATRTKTMSANS